MASLIRGFSRLGPRILLTSCRTPLTKPALVLQSRFKLFHPACFISTSNKNKDSVTVGDKSHRAPSAKQEKLENLEEKEENWISYGYSMVDRDADEWAHHLLLFFVITLTFCWGTLYLAYYPDFKNNAWAQREAYLELARREKAGLPLIDANLIDPSKIELPSEEELGDFEIII